MDVDAWVRRVSIAALPLLALAVWYFRADPSEEHAAPIVPSAARAASEVAEAPSANAKSSSPADIQAYGEKALGSPSAGTPGPSQLAADLPLLNETPSSGADGRAAGRRLGHAGDRSRAAGSGPCGGLEVRLITASHDPQWTFASLATGPGEPAQIRRVGESLSGFRVAKIEWDRVWLQARGGRCAVGMHPGARQGMELAGGKPRRKTSDDPLPWQLPEAIASAIEKRSETEYVIAKEVVPAIFDRGSELLSGLQLEALARGETLGLELEGVPIDSLLERLGVQSGDVLLALAGQKFTTLEAALTALRDARDAQRLVARFERQGQSFDLELTAR